MQTLSQCLTESTFNIPKRSPEEWARINAEVNAWNESNEIRKKAVRFINSGIPQEYKDATLENLGGAIADFAAEPKAPGLLMIGAPGRGKTYAACAVLLANLDRQVKFRTMNGVLSDLKASFNGGASEAQTMALYRGTSLLAIDDLGKENPTDWALPQLFELINGRKEALLPTIITTQYHGAELFARLSKHGDQDTAAAIISRLKEYRPIEFTGPDLRRRKL